MSHFAEINKNNEVLRVLVGDNSLPNEGLDWFVENLGGRWIQTSYNKRFRVHFAAPGYTYDEQLDAFIPPKPFDSWTLDQETCLWMAPIEMPQDGSVYSWNEDSQSWDLLEVPEA